MKRLTGFLLAGLLLLTAAPAWAQQAYLSGNIGFGIRPDADFNGGPDQFDNDPAFVINGAIGVELNPTIRVEGEIGLHSNTADLFSVTSNEFTFSMVSFMGNGYFDIPTNSPLRPYLGAGLGLAIAGVEEENIFGADSTDTDLVAAFQLMAGLGFDISPKATLNFGYRYFTTSDPNFVVAFSGPFETEFTSHDFLFGARFRF